MTKVLFLLFSILICQGIDLRDIKRFKAMGLESRTNIDTSQTIETNLPENQIINIDQVAKINSYEQMDYFGYNYFNEPENIEIYNNASYPKDYILGPGDEFIIYMWGDTQMNSTFTITNDGTVYFDKIGLVNVSGMNIKKLNETLIRKFSLVYSTMRGANPTTFFDISIGKLKSINVSFVGDLKYPGLKSINPFSTVTLGLIQSGGINISGSLRNIEVVRGGKIIDFDFYKYNFDNESDFRLVDGDIVRVKSRKSEVVIQGSVYNPGIYEIQESESLADLIRYSGNLKFNARDIIEVNRVNSIFLNNNDSKLELSFYVHVNDFSKFSIKNGDEIFVREIPEIKKEVYIYGQIKQPGKYTFVPGMTIKDILELSGGIKDPSFIKTIDMDNAEIIRRSAEENYPEIIKFSITEVMNKAIDIELQNWDMVLIRKNIYFKEPEKISILGEVKSPGKYTLMNKEEKLSDIILRSGGLSENAFEEGIRLYRDSSQVVLNNYDIALMAQDSIVVPKHPGIVKVTGQVYNESLVQYNSNESLNYYIESAGGYTPDADKSSVVVVYANGDVKIKKFFSTPEIKEGCHIIVYKEELVEPFNTTEFLKEIASIAASLATIFYIINQ